VTRTLCTASGRVAVAQRPALATGATRRAAMAPLAVAALLGAALLLASDTALAQDVIGRLPENAVMRDLNDGQRIGPFAGWIVTGRDPVGVRAKSAPIVGVRYDAYMANPFYFTMRAFFVPSSHDVYRPNVPATSNPSGTAPSNNFGLEAGFELALTGERSWRGIQPLVNVGMGVIAGVANRFDAGGYAAGVSPLYTWGLAVRVPTGRNGEFRADLGWLVHQVRYPTRFRTSTGDFPALRPGGTMTPLTTNRALTAGWTWGVFR